MERGRLCMAQRNYICFTRHPVFCFQYVFVDAADYLARSLFCRNEVQIRVQKIYGREKDDFRLVFCKVRRRDNDRFLTALRELPDKMLLCGRLGYEAVCREIVGGMEEAMPAVR